MKTQCVKTSVRPSCAQLDAGGWLVSKNKLGRRQTIHLDEDVSDGVVCLSKHRGNQYVRCLFSSDKSHADSMTFEYLAKT